MIIKIILTVISIILLYKTIIETNTEKAFDYLFDAVTLFSIVFLIKPI